MVRVARYTHTQTFGRCCVLLVRDVAGPSLPNHVTNLSHSESVFHGTAALLKVQVCAYYTVESKPLTPRTGIITGKHSYVVRVLFN